MEQEHRDLFDLGLQADLTMLQQSLLTRRRLLVGVGWDYQLSSRLYTLRRSVIHANRWANGHLCGRFG
ncbi:MAG: hypothetical protein ACUVSL_06065 [Chloroflexus sp.]|uniref:hypothetical protein n=1 Tax=Chloroflexus sp. TaxID=1904827 RepID=UPI00404B0DC8